jgi:pyruvate kinase
MTKASHKNRNKHHQERPPADAWDEDECKGVIEKLWALRAAMQASEKRLAPLVSGADATYQASARNLAHYLALRHDDQRALQEWLTHAGVSSLGRSESHAMANLDKVLGILHRLTGQAWATHDGDEPIGTRSSRKLLERHTADLLGPSPAERSVRIMVTLPSEAASDFGLVRQLVASGMDIARINCAHDGPDEWKAMASRVRRAARAVGRPVRILMDLGGPKLRTGVLAQGAALLKLRPQRDDFGRLVAAAHVGLRPAGATMPVAGASVHAGVDADWLAQLEVGDRIDFKDARGARRCLVVLHTDETGALAACEQTAYLVPDTTLKHDHKGKKPRRTTLTELPVAKACCICSAAPSCGSRGPAQSLRPCLTGCGAGI